ncbi:hypothetical protein BCR32DRAFT_290581 [Anaeromyces robustus]|uniref:SWIRM domain-containing protein n=1 Tax=Anaeromyces robustus TaxID=1754192 RepID=A0A1Y1XJJ1_9FUNG|nr:hypothetical protein BCR32DRAFT_290581 [Anaeromyces robustus]|eukprot:ORX85596.1 hypothetical protein BCR32DRAFT_290581 [Anaeromyces robustus]
MESNALTNNNNKNNTYHHHKRKCDCPQKSISSSLSKEEKENQKIQKLDVYEVYSKEPEKLLYFTSDIYSYHNPVVKNKKSGNKKATRSRSVTPARSVKSYSSVKTPTTRDSLSQQFKAKNKINNNIYNYVVENRVNELFNIERYKIKDGTYIPPVVWKGNSLDISSSEVGYNLLSKEEIKTCSTLRLFPLQYLNIKYILISAREEIGFFSKKDAQKWIPIDVNKTCKLYDWFQNLGWILTNNQPDKRNRKSSKSRIH